MAGYVCSGCGWTHQPHSIYGWQKHDDRAVEVHKSMLCPQRLELGPRGDESMSERTTNLTDLLADLPADHRQEGAQVEVERADGERFVIEFGEVREN